MELSLACIFAEIFLTVCRLIAFALFVVLSPLLFSVWTIKHAIEMHELRSLANSLK